MGSFNAGRAVRDFLIGENGFAECDSEYKISRRVDRQHSLIFEDGHWHRGPKGGYTTVSPKLWVARRDLNDLSREISNPGSVRNWECRPTLNVTAHLDIEWALPHRLSSQSRTFKGPEEWLPPWVDSWLPVFADKAPHMPFLTEVLAKQSNGTRAQRDWVRGWRKLTAMLDGSWTEAHDEEFLAPIERFLADPESNESTRTLPKEKLAKLIVNRQAVLDRTRAWLAEHPDGIERELMD